MYVQSQPQQDCRVDLVCMYVRDGDSATFLCCAHGRTLASDTIYIYNIIYTCFTCTKIITLHSVTVTAVCHQVACTGRPGLPGQQSRPLFHLERVPSWCAPTSLAQKVHARNSDALSVVVDYSHNSLDIIVTLAQPF